MGIIRLILIYVINYKIKAKAIRDGKEPNKYIIRILQIPLSFDVFVEN